MKLYFDFFKFMYLHLHILKCCFFSYILWVGCFRVGKSAPKGKVAVCIVFEGNAIELVFLVHFIKINCYLSSEISNLHQHFTLFMIFWEIRLECETRPYTGRLCTNVPVIASPSKAYFDKLMVNFSFRKEVETLKKKQQKNICSYNHFCLQCLSTVLCSEKINKSFEQRY